MPRDAYIVWRYLLERGRLASELERTTLRDKDWDIGRTHRAVTKAVGAGWVHSQQASRVGADGQSYADYMLTARQEEGELSA